MQFKVQPVVFLRRLVVALHPLHFRKPEIGGRVNVVIPHGIPVRALCLRRGVNPAVALPHQERPHAARLLVAAGRGGICGLVFGGCVEILAVREKHVAFPVVLFGRAARGGETQHRHQRHIYIIRLIYIICLAAHFCFRAANLPHIILYNFTAAVLLFPTPFLALRQKQQVCFPPRITTKLSCPPRPSQEWRWRRPMPGTRGSSRGW